MDARADKRVVMDLGLTRINQNIPVMQKDIRVDANIHGWISPGLDTKWMLTHQEDIDVDVTQAEFRLFGNTPVSIKREVQERVNIAAPKVIKTAFDSMRDKLPIRSEMEKAWRRLFKPIKVGSHPDAYIVLRPEGVRLQKLAFDDPDSLTIRTTFDGTIQTMVLDTAPPEAAPTPIPDLVIESGSDPRFHALLPVGLEWSTVNRTLKEQVGDQRTLWRRTITRRSS